MHIFYTDQHKLHATDQTRPEDYPFILNEVPARAEMIWSAVQAARLGPVIAPVDYGLDPILAVHAPDFVAFLQQAYAQSQQRSWPEIRLFPDTFATRYTGRKPSTFPALKGYYAFDPYSPILAGTWTAAYWSAQCAVAAADHVRTGGRIAYALCRPPGHHAAADMYGGFCYLNNAAIAARYLQQTGPEMAGPDHHDPSLSRIKVAILDIDYHHGNGAQEIFYADPSVLYGSLHADPVEEYPYYWGAADERGSGSGQGYNYNWPLPRGTGETDYLAALTKALVVIRAFEPRYLVVSAGFDIVADDPVGGFTVTTAGLHEIGRRIAALELPTVIVQEGGYLRQKLGENAVAFLRAFG